MSFLAIIILLWFLGYLIYHGIARKRNPVLIKQAIENGRVVEARLESKKVYYMNRNDSPSSRKVYECKYTYIVKGQTYHYKKDFLGEPKDTIKLYWNKNPKKALESELLGFCKKDRLILLIGFFSSIVLYMIIYNNVPGEIKGFLNSFNL